MNRWIVIGLFLLIIIAGCTILPEQSVLRLASPAPTMTASPTLPPPATLTPTPTLTPSPTPTPTPRPSEVLESAEHAYRMGDWQQAELLYQRLMPLSYITQQEAVSAMLGLGKTLLAQDKITAGMELLTSVATEAGQSDAAVAAHLQLADALRATGQSADAVPHYQAVLAARPVLTTYAHEWLGDAHFATGVYPAALSAYSDALDEATSASRQVYLWEKIALAQTARQVYPETMAAYDAILDIARIPAYRARISYQAAEAARYFGETEEALRRYHELITVYPQESQAYEALVQLVEAGEPVNELLRGQIDYRAGAYGPAVQAFHRQIEAVPEHTGEPHYYAGLSFLEAGSPELALQEFETLLADLSGDAYWGSAWIGKARALAALGRVDDAVAAYRELPAALPAHPRAPAALWSAAELLEDESRLPEAAELFLALAEQYPGDRSAPAARFRAGLDRYRTESSGAAVIIWEDLLRWYPADELAQGARFWLGKTYLEAGSTLSGTAYLSRTVAVDEWGYYGLRAAELLAGRGPLVNPAATLLPCGDEIEQQAVVDWLASWIGLDPLPDLSVPPEALKSDPRLERGLLLLELGHFDEGRAELESLRVAYGEDAWAQYHLALSFRDAGLYRSSILAASTVWRLSPAETADELPRFLGCLLYPRYFSTLVEREAVELGFDSLVLYALLRQESLFEGFATSFAAAHGLMQVIPPTGAQIAEALAWPPDYETEDLYRPLVSVRFGTWYLAQQRERFEGELYPALAGYNGGPGNAARWWEAAGEDRDLFVELIGFQETRTYVERITEHYEKYVWFWTLGGSER
ncbi:MAG: tetratricopeptide repeat protein [Chloroflexota bacterium]|nr:tetratricopeptide repeat protein [Chloroflexota bacterium]